MPQLESSKFIVVVVFVVVVVVVSNHLPSCLSFTEQVLGQEGVPPQYLCPAGSTIGLYIG